MIILGPARDRPPAGVVRVGYDDLMAAMLRVPPGIRAAENRRKIAEIRALNESLPVRPYRFGVDAVAHYAERVQDCIDRVIAYGDDHGIIGVRNGGV